MLCSAAFGLEVHWNCQSGMWIQNQICKLKKKTKKEQDFYIKILINQISILKRNAGKYSTDCEILWAKILLLKAYFPDVL